MQLEHNAARVEATKAPTCELMRGPMLSSKAVAPLLLLHFYEGREHTPGYRSHMCVQLSKGAFFFPGTRSLQARIQWTPCTRTHPHKGAQQSEVWGGPGESGGVR